MTNTLRVERRQVLAYRIAAQQLDRVELRPAELAVLDLGVQDTPYGSARLALAARTSAELDDESLALVWAARGAPHLHRRAELPRIAKALWPLSDADAAKRIVSTQIREAGKLGLAAFEAAADAFSAVVAGPTATGEVVGPMAKGEVSAPMAKGEVSGAVTARVPAEVTYPCRPCQATHISGALFQQAGLAGGVELTVVGGKTMIAPVPDWAGRPEVAAGTADLIATYLRLLGPATLAEAAKHVGTSQTELRPVWPDGLTEMTVDGRRTWLPTDRIDALRNAPPPRLVRLLPAGDPYLSARDRDLLVPDKTRQSEVWRVLGNPGALLVDNEIVGVWRAKLAGRSRLEVTVTPFEPLPNRVRSAIDDEARVLAQARGAADVRVSLAE
ncbi:DNA glycosylase AlkZ-like family protein [Micromonospora sp. NPDC003197]